MRRPSLRPVVTVSGCGRPSFRIQIWRWPPSAVGVSPLRFGVLPPGGRGISFDSRPALSVAAGAAVPVVGVKRSAVLGTVSTPRRSVAAMVAVAVMPGRRLRSALSTFRSVA